MSNTFTAIDFETAQGKRWSICQVGLVRVEEGRLVNKLNLLVCPPGNIYMPGNTMIHGISERHTYNSPKFASVWPLLRPYIENETVVAHNGAFDFNCLSQTLTYYNIQQPRFTQQCTYKIFGKGLKACCSEHRISLNHHDALSDAMACAQLYLIHLNR
ncbi:3'-5' exoribonuclease [Mucilaginibacter sp. BJC16-A38]|uniref:exonuclease domain-containing protein n=1 Tax=Mucilaginibacter phenanthrenivorans TaxID=1234842 RepID=UPI0021575C97|nr:exonuclease domain-containing protein [Mucilaginibacter phenanthrenivorans]MCR8560831.1 3'-5' exoribonuclease [Mucilaginibacter phenanthrenivorans]